jgi:hypothetical protein
VSKKALKHSLTLVKVMEARWTRSLIRPRWIQKIVQRQVAVESSGCKYARRGEAMMTISYGTRLQALPSVEMQSFGLV